MRRLTILFSFLVLLGMACSLGSLNEATPVPVLEIQTQPQTEVPIPITVTEANVPANAQILEGPNINYNGIRFTLDPAIGSRLYVFNEEITSADGVTAHNIRFALRPEEYCQTWCVMIYPVAEFERTFGTFVFPPAGYSGGAAVIFKAQGTSLSFQNGSGDRGLETFGQNHYGVSNESLKYVFRGYSTDKQYGVFVQIPARAANLPDASPTMTTNAEDVLGYNQRAAESMNGLTPADFTPNLDLLDALVASIRVEAP